MKSQNGIWNVSNQVPEEVDSKRDQTHNKETMYRTTRKVAWWPKKVWKSLLYTDPGYPTTGIWVRIWMRPYWIVERANHSDLVDDVHPLRWEYYVGDYYYEEDAAKITKEKTNGKNTI